MALLGTAWIIKNMGPLGIVGELTLGALNGKGKRYDEHMDEVMKKSEEDMWKNGAYREMRKAGRTDHQARFSHRNETREDGIGCGGDLRGDQGHADGGSGAAGEECGGVVRV